MKKYLRNKRGITLIALIVTIIVLLLLAGVAISMLTGDNGILNKAIEAKKRTEDSEDEEDDTLEEMAYLIAMNNKEAWSGKEAKNYESGDGTEANPYIIKTAEQLALLSKNVNEGNDYSGTCFKLGNDIDLQYKKWTPIGMGKKGSISNKYLWNEISVKPFEGIFDGDNHKIKGINISEAGNAGVGVFGTLGENGIIKNVIVGKGKVVGRACVAGIVGENIGTVTNCTNNAEITAQDCNEASSGEAAGGIIGNANGGQVTNCKNNGNVTTKNDSKKTGRGKCAGGIIGHIYASANINIENCTNNGTITSYYQQAGGILGGNSSTSETYTYTINLCTNTGDIIVKYTKGLSVSGMDSGGIVGWINGGESIKNCTNSGKIIAESQCSGGIAGQQSSGTISECVNTGEISSLSKIARGISGGIIGVQDNGKVEKSYNIGKIKNTNYNNSTLDVSGGIVGFLLNASTIKYCYSSCEFEGEDAKGEIVGQWNTSSTASVSDCYYTDSNGITGIGSKGTVNTTISPAADAENGISTTDYLGSYEAFKNFLNSKLGT